MKYNLILSHKFDKEFSRLEKKLQVSTEEMAEILDIDTKMRRGERTRLNEALAELNV